MAFGLFKKNEKAESVFHNGHIYTQDGDLPWVTAVACAGGKIIAVGDFEAMEELVDGDTNVVDLKEQYMFPGFIDSHSISVLKTFEDKYFAIDEEWKGDEIIANLAEYIEEHPDLDMYFGYGYSENILQSAEDFPDADDLEEEALEVELSDDEMADDDENSGNSLAMLDELCPDKPIVLLSSSSVHLWYNTAAQTIIEETAEEECVQIITVPYVLNLFVPFDFEEVEAAVKQELEDNCDKGYTTIFNNNSPDFFEDYFIDSLMGLVNEGDIPQRFYGSLFCGKPINPEALTHRLMQKKTSCIELGDIMKYNFIKLKVAGAEFSQEALDTIMLAVADRGFNIYIEAPDAEGLLKAYNGFEAVYSKGYKNAVGIIASDYELEDDAMAELPHSGDIIETWPMDLEEYSIADYVDDVSEAIDELTVYAAEMLGEEDRLGSIEKGKLADFTVFEQNPLDTDLKTFCKMHATMTIIDGQVVYDAEEMANDEMYNLMASQQL
ncbi:MAG TPA: amidohydrolase family protein [Anaerovoracaceae bacterium]|nr:amidohydrolase family protein [Anaerovoracaceae bacterium]